MRKLNTTTSDITIDKQPRRDRTGIIVFGHSRPMQLQNLLESLRRQGTKNDIHVWLDGHHGRPPLVGSVRQCLHLVRERFPQVHLTAMTGNLGIEKLMIDGLSFMALRYDRIIVLEDDCFPTANAIDEFEHALDEISMRPEVYSVYGHHFLTESEGDTITRFQGWGWATTRQKLLPVLAEIKRCFAMSEPEYLQWVRANMTPDVRKRLDVTPGRNCVKVASSFFCWDACTCVVTAARRLVHKKTAKRVIYNCGMGNDSTHFPENDKFRHPPFNMITPQEVWNYYDIGSSQPASLPAAVPAMPSKTTSLGVESQRDQAVVSISDNYRGTNILTTEETRAMERAGNPGENLIFLISQPRGGSTLLQRIIGGHPEIHTVAEPWIMLHPLYALKQEGITTEYLSCRAREGLEDFLADVPEGQELYIKALREMALILYNRMRQLSGKRFFLDKTPRYYYIIPELHRVFPKAHFIILLRNPMAVLSSILSTWMKNRPDILLKNAHYPDAMKGPHCLIDGIKQLKEDAIVVHYENLVEKPKDTVQRLCDRIDIPFYEDMLEYGRREPPKGRFGDPIGVHKHNRPYSGYIDKWVQNLSSPDLIEFAREYLSTLGPAVFSQMGYSYEETKNKLELNTPPDKVEQAGVVPSLPQSFALNSTKQNAVIGEPLSGSPDYLVSAIVSTYNSERFIRGCLEDLENQTIANRIEVIVVNSGSQENEEAVIKEFQQKYNNIKYIKTEQRETIYKAWNRAIKAASGRYITNANTDDRHRQDAFEIMTKALDENPDIALVYTDQLQIKEIKGRRVEGDRIINGQFSRDQLFDGKCPPGSQPMWRKEVHNGFGYFDENFIISGDYEFWFRLTQKFDFLYLDEVLGYRYVSPEAVSQSNDTILKWENEIVIRKCYEYALQENLIVGPTGISKHPTFCNWPEVNIWKLNTKSKLTGQQISLTDNVKDSWDYRTNPSPKLSIIIVTYNRRKELLENLYALNDQTEKDFEVIVIDNGSDLSWLKQRKDEFNFGLCGIELKINFGPSPARNIGTQLTKAEYIAFLDDDAIADNYLITNIVEHFNNHSIYGLRGKVLLKSQTNIIDIPTNYNLGDQIINTSCEVSCLSAFRKDFFLKIEGFDDLLFGPEGMELSYRICKNQKNIKSILYFPDLVVYHDPCSDGPSRSERTLRQFWMERLTYRKDLNIKGYIELVRSLYPANRDNFEENCKNHIWVTNIALYLRENFPEESFKWAKRAVNMEPLNVKACFTLGSLCTQLGIFDKAATLLERVLTLLQGDMQAYYSDNSDTSRENWILLADCYLSAATKLAQCFIQRGEHGKLKTVYSQLLAHPYLKLTSEQQSRIQGVLSKVENVKATAIGNGMDGVPAEAFSGKSAESKSKTNSTDEIQVNTGETHDPYLVSAIVSTYNAESFLRGCLDDLEQQTIADKLEIIVVNSNSQENEEAIVREYQQRYNNIIYIKTKQREGIYSAWNRAVKVARGSFLTNANTDDRHRNNAMEIMAETLLANPDVALVYGNQICTDTPNGTFDDHHATEMAKRPEYSRERLLFGCCVGSQPMWRKSLHDELGDFDESLDCAGDWDFWLRISSKYKFKHIPDFLGLYYYNKQGIEHGRKIHSLYERYIVGKRYGNPYISVIPLHKSKDNPLVSVIMPAYNAAAHIAEAIESVLIQNYRNLELVVVDDGSTDNTKDIVTAFKDERIKYFYKNNSGPSGARNLAISKARGQYVMSLDADDMMTPDSIARHMIEFENHSDVDLVYCDVLLIDERSNPIRIMNKSEYKNRRHLIRDMFRAGHPIVPFRLGIRRNVFDKIGLYDEDLLVGEDYDMIRRFVQHGLKVQHLPDALYLRRMGSHSLSRNFNPQKAKSHFEVVKRFVDTFRYDELFPDVDWKKISPDRIELHTRCLVASTYLAMGRAHKNAKSPPCYVKTAFEMACQQLNECLKIEPENLQISELILKCKRGREMYVAQLQEAVT
jgi:glycosyltransferase involved in cell wall biosynthesis